MHGSDGRDTDADAENGQGRAEQMTAERGHRDRENMNAHDYLDARCDRSAYKLSRLPHEGEPRAIGGRSRR